MKPVSLALATFVGGIAIAASPLDSQISIPPLDVEIRASTGVFGGQALSDGEPSVGIASGWVQEGTRPVSLEGTLRLATGGMINPYVGIHYRTFQESAEDDVMRRVYGDYLLEQGEISGFAASHRMHGVGAGLSVETDFGRNGLMPFVTGEVTVNRFDSRTSLAMNLPPESEFGEKYGSWYEGESHMRTRTGLGWAAGVGARMPLGSFEARPAIRYAAAQAPVRSRMLTWEAGTDDQPHRGGTFDASGLDGQRVTMHHVELSIGLSWGISR